MIFKSDKYIHIFLSSTHKAYDGRNMNLKTIRKNQLRQNWKTLITILFFFSARIFLHFQVKNEKMQLTSMINSIQIKCKSKHAVRINFLPSKHMKKSDLMIALGDLIT